MSHIPRSIVLKDLVAIDSQAKDHVNPAQGLLNMNKYRSLWRVFCGIRSSQITPPLLTPNLDRMRVLRVSVWRNPRAVLRSVLLLQAAIGQSNLTEEALEELSEAREPRQRAGVGMSRVTNLPKFATWAGGEQPQLDSVTISKHVKQMVDVSLLVMVECVCGDMSLSTGSVQGLRYRPKWHHQLRRI